MGPSSPERNHMIDSPDAELDLNLVKSKEDVESHPEHNSTKEDGSHLNCLKMPSSPVAAAGSDIMREPYGDKSEGKQQSHRAGDDNDSSQKNGCTSAEDLQDASFGDNDKHMGPDHGKDDRGESGACFPQASPSPSPAREGTLALQKSRAEEFRASPYSSSSPRRSPSLERRKYSSPVRTPLRDSDQRIDSPFVRKRSSSPGNTSQEDSRYVVDSSRKRSQSSPQRKGSPRKFRSPRRRDSPHKHLDSPPGKQNSSRRRNRSVSRSPAMRRELSGYKRDHRDRSRSRSRSRSPHGRDHHRRSPRRRRKSPRHRSPSPGYHTRPRRRAWSPPSNRSTGIGKPGNNLFIAGFSFVTTERDLEKKFSRFGRVTDVRVVRDKRSGDSRGFGFLSLERDEDADAAIQAIDQTEWNGRIVLVEKAKTSIR